MFFTLLHLSYQNKFDAFDFQPYFCKYKNTISYTDWGNK